MKIALLIAAALALLPALAEAGTTCTTRKSGSVTITHCSTLWLLAGFIALLRCVVWCSFRWPLTTMFFVSFFSGLMGGRRRRW